MLREFIGMRWDNGENGSKKLWKNVCLCVSMMRLLEKEVIGSADPVSFQSVAMLQNPGPMATV